MILVASGVFFASGVAALLYQVIWQRLLVMFSGADVQSVTLIVAAFMGGLGVGNLAGIDYRRRSAENMVDALMSTNDFVRSPAIGGPNDASFGTHLV